jgi:hypothetical protein
MKTLKRLIKKSMVLFMGLIVFLSCSMINQQEYTNTMVIGHLNEKVDPGQNIVYASSFLMAWKGLKEDMVGEDILLQEPVSLTPQLNLASEKIVIDENYLAMAGITGDGIVKKINKQLQQKYGFKNRELEQYLDRDDNIICYSYFIEEVLFKYPFMEHKKKHPFFFNKNRAEVACFGLEKNNDLDNGEKIMEQVELYDYIDCNNFIIKLKGKDPENELYLAKVPFDKTMIATLDGVEQRVQATKPEKIDENALLVIPKIKFNLYKTYDELIGKHLANNEYEDYFFAVADQQINFSLDESGAKTQSESVVVLKKGPSDGLLLFDRPFLLYMKKKGTNQPYFALWIANPEILIK